MSWLPLSLLYLAAHCLSAVLSDAVASVSNVPAFVYALNDASIQEVRIDARELRLDDGSWPAEIVKIDVNRSVLVKPASTAQGYPYLDLGKHFSRIYLQEGSALTFQQVAFFGNDGASLWSDRGEVQSQSSFQNTSLPLLSVRQSHFVYRVCPTKERLEQPFTQPHRPPSLPGQQQFEHLEDGHCEPEDARSRCFARAGRIVDYAYIARSDRYEYIIQDSLVLCERVVSDACVLERGLQACLATMLQGLGPDKGAGDLQPSQTRDTVTRDAVLGAVLGSMGLAAVVAGVALAVQHHRSKQDKLQPFVAGSKSSSTTHADSCCSEGSDLELGRNVSRGSGSYGGLALHVARSLMGDLQLGLMLGCGSLSRVYQGRWNGHQVAVRRMVHSPTELQGLQRALGTCQRLKHPNVVEQLHSFTIDYSMSGIGGFIKKRWELEVQRTSPCSRATISTSPFPEPLDTSILLNSKRAESYRETYAIQEFCNQGSLSSALYVGHFTTVASDGNWCPNLVAILEVALGVATGMEYLHSQSICHGGLQASCVLLNTHADGTLVAKVVPSEVQQSLGRRQRLLQTGTLSHTSPQRLSSGSLQFQDDVFSFGFLIWEMVAGTASPHSSSSGQLICSAGCLSKKTGAFPPGMHKGVLSLVLQCWSSDPHLRPTFAELKQMLAPLMEELRQDAGSNSSTWSRNSWSSGSSHSHSCIRCKRGSGDAVQMMDHPLLCMEDDEAGQRQSAAACAELLQKGGYAVARMRRMTARRVAAAQEQGATAAAAAAAAAAMGITVAVTAAEGTSAKVATVMGITAAMGNPAMELAPATFAASTAADVGASGGGQSGGGVLCAPDGECRSADGGDGTLTHRTI